MEVPRSEGLAVDGVLPVVVGHLRKEAVLGMGYCMDNGNTVCRLESRNCDAYYPFQIEV